VTPSNLWKNFTVPETRVFQAACTREIWDSQKVENSARFQTSFDFDRECLKNRSGYQKSETNLIDIYPCWVQQKIGELLSTNKNVAGADVDPPLADNARSANANALEFGPRDCYQVNFTPTPLN